MGPQMMGPMTQPNPIEGLVNEVKNLRRDLEYLHQMFMQAEEARRWETAYRQGREDGLAGHAAYPEEKYPVKAYRTNGLNGRGRDAMGRYERTTSTGSTEGTEPGVGSSSQSDTGE